MAPSAVETVTVPVVQSTKARTHFGAYKELAPTKFDAEAEAGKKGFEGAKVRLPRVKPTGNETLTFYAV